MAQPPSERRARLRIVSPEPRQQAQDCGTCRNQPNCLAGETEFITRAGVKNLAECAGTTQTVLTRSGRWVEAEVKSFGVQRLYKVTLRRQHARKMIYATAEHGWFVMPRHTRTATWQRVTTMELQPGAHRLQGAFSRGSLKKGASAVIPSPFGIAHGFVFGDGSTKAQKISNEVHLFGEKDLAMQKYFELCSSYPVKNGTRYAQIPNHFRELPSLEENTSYLVGWLMGYLAADGCVSKEGYPVISSVTHRHIEFYRDVCILVGIAPGQIQKQTRMSNLTGAPSTIYTMSLSRSSLTADFFLLDEHRRRFEARPAADAPREWIVEAVEPTERVEEVYCAEVPEHHAFALEGNILTSNCWMPKIKEEHIILNLLTCRIKRGIDVNRSAKLFLEMVRPKLKTFAKYAVAGTNIDIATALADMEAETIRYLQHHYIMGEIAYPLHRLFGRPSGHVFHYANNYARKERKFEETHFLEEPTPPEWDPNMPSEDEEPETDLTRHARAVIDDGVTLTLHEYRVLKFCLANATEAKRPLNGLHVFLARTMGVVRARVTRIYKDASEKLVSETRTRL